MRPFLYLSLSMASHDSLMQKTSKEDKGMQIKISPDNSLHSTDLLITLCTRVFRGTCFSQKFPVLLGSDNSAYSLPFALIFSSCKEKKASCQEVKWAGDP